MKRILLPTDFSDIAKNALQCAASLAKIYDAEIIALYMINRDEAFLSRKEAMDLYKHIDYHKRINDSFQDFLAQDFLNGVKMKTEIRKEVNFYKMADLAKELDIDLIVMGSHGAHGLEGMIIGSNTEKVIRTSDIPVLVVKKAMPDFKPEKVVMACDLNLDMIEAFKKGRSFLEENSIDYDMLYINTPEDFLSSGLMEKEAEKFFGALGNGESSLKDKIVFYNDYNIEEGIFNYARRVNADLIVLLTHGRKGLAHVIYQSYGENIANHSDIPILTIKA